KPLAGVMHLALFWGFIFLLIATAAFAAWERIGFPEMTGWLYYLISWLADVGGFFAMLGIVVLAFIRYIRRPDRLNDHKPADGWILALVFAILLGGFLVEGLRIAAQIKLSTTLQQIAYEQDASPVGWMFAWLFKSMSLDGLVLWHRLSWWSHMFLAFLFIAVVPFTKLWHIFTGMIGYYSRDLDPKAVPLIENIEEAERFGVERIEENTWKDLLDLDACIR
ncbi:MAG TPA: FeS-binding protein, partial [Syntrophomonas sp.]|nr:FeS-binding protein [Syntrophomonas sp.]